MKLLFLAGCVFLCATLSSIGRQYDFRRFTVEHGLPSSNVFQVLQDKQGYIWFATDNGVSRYDGRNFRTFTAADGFTDYGAFRMIEDSFGRLWFMTFSGSVCWYSNGVFTPFRYLYNGKPLSISWVVEDAQRDLWLSSAEGIVVRVKPDGSSQAVEVSSHKRINSKLTHSIALPGGVAFFAEEFYLVSNDMRVSRLPYSNAMPVLARFFRRSDGTTLLSNNTGIYAVNRVQQRPVLLFGKQLRGEVFDIYEDPEHRTWVATADGVRCFHNGLTGDSVEYLLRDYRVVSVLCDRENNYWFATDNGAFMLSSLNISLYREAEGLASTNIVGMKRWGDSGLLLVTRDGRLYSWSNGRAVLFSEQLVLTAPLLPEFVAMTSFSRDSIVVRFARTGAYLIEPHRMRSVPTMAYPLYCAPDGSTWSYEGDSVYRTYRGQRRAIYPRLDYTNAYSVYEKFVVDSRNCLWIGTRRGLFRQDSSGLTAYGEQKLGLRSAVAELVYTNDGRIWVATRGQGVFCIHGNSVEHITTAQGLTDDNCSRIVSDSTGAIWVVGRTGVSWLVVLGGRVVVRQTYAIGDLLPGMAVCAVERYGHTMFFAGSAGLLAFDMRSVRPNTTPPPVYITRVTAGGRAIAFDSVCTIDYNSGVISAEYTGIVLRRPGVRSYRYRLLAGDTVWNYTNSNAVQIASLQPGRYTLEVQAQNNSRLWSTTSAMLHIVVVPPYWQLWWFRAAALTAALMAVAGAVLLVVRHRDRQNAVQRRLLEMELLALRSQMNPHFIFNALNSIQDFVLHQQSRTANLYLTKFARLMRLILEYSRQPAIALESEIEFLQLYIDLEQLRFEPTFVYKIVLDSALEHRHVRIPPMIIQPVVENAIKHGLAPKLETGILVLGFELRGSALRCTVEDNGVGRATAGILDSRETKHTSIGLTNIRERLALSHGSSSSGLQITDLYDSDGVPAGTKVEIDIPLL